jgi:hypothetical protein
MIATDGVAEFYQLQMLPSNESNTIKESVPEIEQLLNHYPQLFEEPKGLPPIRET